MVGQVRGFLSLSSLKSESTQPGSEVKGGWEWQRTNRVWRFCSQCCRLGKYVRVYLKSLGGSCRHADITRIIWMRSTHKVDDYHRYLIVYPLAPDAVRTGLSWYVDQLTAHVVPQHPPYTYVFIENCAHQHSSRVVTAGSPLWRLWIF